MLRVGCDNVNVFWSFLKRRAKACFESYLKHVSDSQWTTEFCTLVMEVESLVCVSKTLYLIF